MAFILLLSAFQHDSCPPLYIDEKTVILNKYILGLRDSPILQRLSLAMRWQARRGEIRTKTKERDTEKEKIETAGEGNENRRGVQNGFNLNFLFQGMAGICRP